MTTEFTTAHIRIEKELWKWVRINAIVGSEKGQLLSASDYVRKLIEADRGSKPTPPVNPDLLDTPSWSKEACDDWAKTLGNPQGGRIGIALKPLVKKHGWATVRPVWQRYLAQKDPKYASPSDFASKFSVWQSGPISPSSPAQVGKPEGHVDHDPSEEGRVILRKVSRKEKLTDYERDWFDGYMNAK